MECHTHYLRYFENCCHRRWGHRAGIPIAPCLDRRPKKTSDEEKRVTYPMRSTYASREIRSGDQSLRDQDRSVETGALTIDGYGALELFLVAHSGSVDSPLTDQKFAFFCETLKQPSALDWKGVCSHDD